MWDIYTTCTNRHTVIGYICLGHFMPGRCRWSTEPVGLTQPRTMSGVTQGDLSVSQGDATGIYMFRAFHARAVPVVD